MKGCVLHLIFDHMLSVGAVCFKGFVLGWDRGKYAGRFRHGMLAAWLRKALVSTGQTQCSR